MIWNTYNNNLLLKPSTPKIPSNPLTPSIDYCSNPNLCNCSATCTFVNCPKPTFVLDFQYWVLF